MKIEFDDRTLILTPESEADTAQLVAVLGPFPEGVEECESTGEAHGSDVTMHGGAVHCVIEPASWNHDPVYD